MNPKNILLNLSFIKEVPARTQTYYVYESEKQFILMTVSKRRKNGYNFNTVSKAAVKYVENRFAGKRAVTSTAIISGSNRPEFITNPLEALNLLYAMCAKGTAILDLRYKQRQLVFNVR
jgi:hypothetical protein